VVKDVGWPSEVRALPVAVGTQPFLPLFLVLEFIQVKLEHLAPVFYEIPHRSPELGDFLLVLADAGRGRVDGGREVPVEQVAEEHFLLP